MVKTYSKESNERISDHFRIGEFVCPCTNCKETKIDSDLVDKLEALRKKIGKPLKINSGYRCENYQNELRLRGYETAVGVSQHTEGRAADVMSEDSRLSGTSLEALARSVGFTSIGVGHSWIHCDLRAGYRRWEYSKR